MRTLRTQQATKRSQTHLAKIGDTVRCPECGRTSRVVWISQDHKLAGIQCPSTHNQMTRGPSQYGSTARTQTKRERNMVFLTETAAITAPAPVKR